MSIQSQELTAPDSHEHVDLSTDLYLEEWAPRYGVYSKDGQFRKLDDLHKKLWPLVSEKDELTRAAEETAAFIDHSFRLYEGEVQEGHDGSFAFVVPTRIERDNPDYAEEATMHFPILKYVDPATRQRMLVGMCPFIIDRYGVDDDGRRGYMLFTPLFGDMVQDLSHDPVQMGSIASNVINDTAQFARDRLGVSVVGLGAILPRLTDMGRAINVEGLHTTTGHGGTVHLIAETTRRAINEGLIPNYAGSLGIIGAGAIGSASADTILSRQIADRLLISDNKPDRLHEVIEALRIKYPKANVQGTLNNQQVVNENNGVISAVTTTFNLDTPEWMKADFSGKFILDDSQPGCFNPDQINTRGAELAWVMGRDNTKDGLITNNRFTYGSTGPASKEDVWGCEGEAAAIALTGEHSASIRDIVTPEGSARIGNLFEQIGIGAAPLQRMGKYIVLRTV